MKLFLLLQFHSQKFSGKMSLFSSDASTFVCFQQNPSEIYVYNFVSACSIRHVRISPNRLYTESFRLQRASRQILSRTFGLYLLVNMWIW